MQIGASFSHRHLKYLNIDPLKALKEFKSLGLKWIRLSLYWDEIEIDEGKFNFQSVENLVKFCEKNNIKVVLTTGMKAQRYPEYYLPSWLMQLITTDLTRKITLKNNDEFLRHTLRYIEKSVTDFKKYKCIKVWQVENEPLDPSGKDWWRIDKNFIKEEVNLVRKIDPKRKILINLWGNELSIRKVYKDALKLADIIGFDIYLKRPVSFLKWFTKYIGPLDSKVKIKQIGEEIREKGKEFWISELQAEPWEPDEIVTTKKNPPSFLPQHFEENIKYALSLEPKVILLWGFEYWLARKLQGDNRYMESAKEVIKKYT